MRTTVRLDDTLLAEAKAAAARTRRTLTQVIEDALREALARGHRTQAVEPVDFPTFAGSGLQPSADLDSTAALLDLMDVRATG